MYIILKKKIKYYTKEGCKLFSVMAIALGLIIAIILLKYRPIYKVTLGGQEIGYVEDAAHMSEKKSIYTSFLSLPLLTHHGLIHIQTKAAISFVIIAL